jgi:hypothetical protein
MVWRSVARTCSRSGSPLATRRGRRQAATWRTRRRSVRWLMAGRPSCAHNLAIVQALGWVSSRRIRSPRRWLPRRAGPLVAGRPARWCRGRCSGGSSGAPSPGRSPTGRRWWPPAGRGGTAGSSPGASPRGAGRAVGPADRRDSPLGRRAWRPRWGPHTSGGLVGSAVLWKASATHEATSSVRSSLPVTRTAGTWPAPKPTTTSRLSAAEAAPPTRPALASSSPPPPRLPRLVSGSRRSSPC